MPQGLDRVTVALSSGNVSFSWDERQALMRRLQHVQSRARIRDSFDAVGASRLVELSTGQQTALLLTLEGWALDSEGPEPMPEGLGELRNALIRDLSEAEQ